MTKERISQPLLQKPAFQSYSKSVLFSPLPAAPDNAICRRIPAAALGAAPADAAHRAARRQRPRGQGAPAAMIRLR